MQIYIACNVSVFATNILIFNTRSDMCVQTFIFNFFVKGDKLQQGLF